MKKTLLAVTLGMLVVSGSALADRPFKDRAKVLSAEPIYELVRVNYPEQRCWTEEVYHPGRGYRNSATPTLTGAILGGVVGNQFGRGNGNKAMTIAGALLGASVGNDMGRQSRRGYVSEEQYCETVDRYEEREELAGYRVKYRYKGQIFWTTTDEHPGKFIPVRVRIEPDHRYR
ncbi:MAG: hypothetical protein C0631_13910 [Sedimenticola sp.]|jgi:uncharacterized protein YcfJ|nr:MAG: hypothetical protein C0631_13910 [Sedimenticola sp.]